MDNMPMPGAYLPFLIRQERRLRDILHLLCLVTRSDTDTPALDARLQQ